MKDTPPDVETRYREMILAQTPARRFAMCCNMNSTARALVRAGILSECGGREPEDYRERFFLRFYGRDLDAAQIEKILAHLRSV